MLQTAAQRTLARTLFDIGAIEFGAFRLKHHEKNPTQPPSPVYLNLRTPTNPKPGPLTAEHLVMIGRELANVAAREELFYDRVAGIPNAGCPLANAFSLVEYEHPRHRQHPMFAYLSKATHGQVRNIVRLSPGSYQPGDLILLIDDVITGADTKREAIEAIERAGCIVKDLLVLVDREQGGTEEMHHFDVRVHSVFTLTELVSFYATSGLILQAKADEVVAYLQRI